ncbi:hypothetical protein VTL71DRAFT_1115 [Oculimacula yallundae]
MAYIYRL